ncbi:MAG: hypothetical protein HY719_16780, partial [Planctomycetes bacterium]|nr:hypothetical protein [Planctomycetota bacterium]
YQDGDNDGFPDRVPAPGDSAFAEFFPFDVAHHRFDIQYTRLSDGHLPDKQEVLITVTFERTRATGREEVDKFQKIVIVPYPAK